MRVVVEVEIKIDAGGKLRRCEVDRRGQLVQSNRGGGSFEGASGSPNEERGGRWESHNFAFPRYLLVLDAD